MPNIRNYLLRNWKRRKTSLKPAESDQTTQGVRKMGPISSTRRQAGRLLGPALICLLTKFAKFSRFAKFLIGLISVVLCVVAHIGGQPMTSGPEQASALIASEPASSVNHWLQQSVEPAYKCAKYCSCSTVQAFESTGNGADEESKPKRLVNLTQAKCESSKFSDLLTIDRRTQIIHISLPAEQDQLQQQQQQTRPDGSTLQINDFKTATTATMNQTQAPATPKRKQLNLMTKLLNLNVSSTQAATHLTTIQAASSPTPAGASQFRMPRLMQFTLLREIVLVNLRIEVCDSEVFKRGQRLLKLKWNGNQLKQVSKNCFKHLDKLQELNLDHNQLEELESALFSHLGSLKHLSLAHNRLAELVAHQFTNLSQLISLNLVGNSFKTINLNLFEPMQNSLQLLILAKNQIRSFVLNQTLASVTTTSPSNQSSSQPTMHHQAQSALLFSGVVFRNLIKLNVDFNRFERVKSLQLHKFYNVKFLSIRGNNIATIRDKAFNGLKLVELNLAQNKLRNISRCAFCNSTIKRLNLSENNISTPILMLAMGGVGGGMSGPLVPSAQQLVAGSELGAPEQQPPLAPLPLILNPPASSASMLVLGQSIFGPLFNHLEYLDLSQNKHLANQLEYLLEPLLELQYLNLASIGLDRALPTPTLFKNLRHLSYLNLSMNRLDQLVAETIEPLVELELLDLSQNDFSELDESFLVALDELPLLKFVDFASNPWYCSQCKISTLYEWILRSPIYNATCLAQSSQAQLPPSSPSSIAKLDDDEGQGGAPEAPTSDQDGASPTMMPDLSGLPVEESNLGFIYKQRNIHDQSGPVSNRAGLGAPNGFNGHDPSSSIDFELILDLFQDESSFADALNDVAQAKSSLGSGGAPVPNYQFDGSASLQQEFRARKRQLSERLLKSLASSEDDNSISKTISSVQAVGQLLLGASSPISGQAAEEGAPGGGDELASQTSDQILRSYFPKHDFCLKCEFPSELRSFNLHELIPTDFRYCAGSAPRFTASEPKIGLTLAIVIIGALLVVIIVVIVMYRKKSNTYYPGEDLTDQLDGGGGSGGQGLLQANRKNQPVLSVSSDIDHQYGDATDYSSPPMSQSYSGEESYSGNSQEVDDEDEDEEDEDEEFDDEEDEEEEVGEEDELDEDEEDDDDDDDDEDVEANNDMPDIDDDSHQDGGPPPSGQQHPSLGPPNAGGEFQHGSSHGGQQPPKRSGSSEQAHHSGNRAHFESNEQKTNQQTSRRQTSRELSTGGSRAGTSRVGSNNTLTTGGGAVPNQNQSQSPSQGPSSIGSQATDKSQGSSKRASRRATTNKSQGSLGAQEATGGGSHQQLASMEHERGPSKQGSHYDRDDSTPIFIGPYEPRQQQQQDSHHAAVATQVAPIDRRQRDAASATNSSFERSTTIYPIATPTPASLSATDFMNGSSGGGGGQSPSSLANTTEGVTVSNTSSSNTPPVEPRPAPRHNRHQPSGARQKSLAAGGHRLAPSRMASLASSSNDAGSQRRAGSSMRSSNPKRGDVGEPILGQQQQPQGKRELSPSLEDAQRQHQNQPARLEIGGTQPKTILHQQHQPQAQSLGRQRHQQQRQASEHSTAGSVSFANLEPRHYAPPPTSSHHQRELMVRAGTSDSSETTTNHQKRLARPSQTIAGELSDYEPPVSSSQRAPQDRHISLVRLEPRQTIAAGATSGQLVDMARKSTTSSQSSHGHQLEPADVGPQAFTLPSNHRRQEPAPMILNKDGLESAVDLEQERGASARLPTSSNRTINSNETFEGQPRQVVASNRARPLVKQQPRESPPPLEEPIRQLNRQPSDELGAGQQQSFQHKPMNRGGVAPEEDSLVDFEGQLDELPSDMDESNVELMTATNSSATNAGEPRPRERLSAARAAAIASYQTQSGPALEFDDDDDDEDINGGPIMSSGGESMDMLQGLGPMRVSHSTHSALTQTGSRDFE